MGSMQSSIASLLQPSLLQAAPPPDHSTALFADSRTSDAQRAAGFVGDASGTHTVRPAMIAQPRTAADVTNALAYARANGLGVTSAGTRHAQGGQALRNGAVLLDMTSMNGMSYDPARDTLTVQPGATWDAVQRYLDQYGRSVAVMQSSNIFSVGGSVSVNAHGRDVRFGPIVDSVRGVTVVLPGGQTVHASRSENADLFRHVVGGYGLFGTIVQVELSTVPNEVYRRDETTMPTSDFAQWYATNVRGNPNARLLQAHLSIAPDSLFSEVHTVRFDADPALAGVDASSLPPLKQHDSAIASLWEKAGLFLAERSRLARDLVWQFETGIAPHIGANVVTRNQAMSPPVEYLRSGPSSHTQVLQEYFVPRDHIDAFVGALRSVAQLHDARLLNATIRDVPADTTTALPYARTDSFAIVLYIDEDATPAGQANVDAMGREAAAAAVAQGGSFYLPYALPYTRDEMQAAYPTLSSVVAAHKQVDPTNMLSNSITDLAQRVGAA
jgi:FAD/FMN-containing dehydrogenase